MQAPTIQPMGQAPTAQIMGATVGMVTMPTRPAKSMNMMDAVKTCLQKYVVFKGRASRSEYWWFYLSFVIISFALGFIGGFMYVRDGNEGFLYISYLAYILYPALLSAGVRRIHDHGKSGWLILVPFYNLYLFIAEGEAIPNIYGPVPTNVPEGKSGIQHVIVQQPVQQQYQQPVQQQYQQPVQQQYQQPVQQQYQQPGQQQYQQPEQQQYQQPGQQQYQQPGQQQYQQPPLGP
jgi:uncharacterized membrane protein YhaH (DUF805 family)